MSSATLEALSHTLQEHLGDRVKSLKVALGEVTVEVDAADYLAVSAECDAAIARAEKAEAELVNTQGLLSLSREEHDASILENALLESQIIVLREAEKDHLASAASEQESMYTLRENYDSVLKRAIRAEGRATRAENENVSLVEKLATKEGVIQNWMNLHDEAIERADALATDLAAARAELGALGPVVIEEQRGFGLYGESDGNPLGKTRAIRVVKEAQ